MEFGIFVGGGGVVKDEIKLAISGDVSGELQPIHSWLFRTKNETRSASREMLDANRENKFIHEFDSAETLTKSIYDFYSQRGENIFAKGFDINNLPIYIQEAKKQIPYNYEIIANTLIEEGRLTKRDLKHCLLDLEDGMSTEDICKDFEKNRKNDTNIGNDLRLLLETYQEFKESRESIRSFTQIRMGEIIKQGKELLAENKQQDKGDSSYDKE